MPGVIFCVRRAGIRIQPGFIYKVHVYNGGFVGRRNGIWPTWGTGYCRWKYVGSYEFVGIAFGCGGRLSGITNSSMHLMVWPRSMSYRAALHSNYTAFCTLF